MLALRAPELRLGPFLFALDAAAEPELRLERRIAEEPVARDEVDAIALLLGEGHVLAERLPLVLELALRMVHRGLGRVQGGGRIRQQHPLGGELVEALEEGGVHDRSRAART